MSDSHKTKIAFIIEGIKTEPIVIRNLKNKFFSKVKIETILLPACTNIYALWQKLRNDDTETDIIELVKEINTNQNTKRIDHINNIDFRELNRDDFSEIYLFFDYDGHNCNLPLSCDHNEIMKEMLETFDNETENGKMYISYPMIEAIKHFNKFEICDIDTMCFSKIDIGRGYKSLVANCSARNQLKNYNIDDWQFVIRKYIGSVYCLFDLKSNLSRKDYLDIIMPKTIFTRQLSKYIIKYDCVMILSAFPEFLLDYFKLEILEEYIGYKDLLNINYNHRCKKVDTIKS